MSLLRGIAGFCKDAMVARLPSMLGFLVTHRRDVVGGLVAAAAIALIVTNGLFMQSGPHPAPIFAIKPLPVVANEPTGTVIPRPRPAAVAEAPKSRTDAGADAAARAAAAAAAPHAAGCCRPQRSDRRSHRAAAAAAAAARRIR